MITKDQVGLFTRRTWLLASQEIAAIERFVHHARCFRAHPITGAARILRDDLPREQFIDLRPAGGHTLLKYDGVFLWSQTAVLHDGHQSEEVRQIQIVDDRRQIGGHQRIHVENAGFDQINLAQPDIEGRAKDTGGLLCQG